MHRILLSCSILFFILNSLTWSAQVNPIWKKINTLQDQGNFKQCSTYIEKYLQSDSGKKLTAPDRRKLEYQVDLLNRIRRDYRWDDATVYSQLTAAVKDVTKTEFNKLIKDNYLNWRILDGKRMFFVSSVSNLFMRYPEYAARRVTPDDSAHNEIAWNFYQKALEAKNTSDSPYILPQKYQMEMTITVEPDAVPAGKTVKCWMPFPREVASQKDIKFISSNVPLIKLAPGDAPMRSAYFEQKATKGKPTEFKMKYEYTFYARYQPIDPAKVKPYNKKSAEYIKWTEERPPHVVFDKDIKTLSKEIIGKETNPYLKARKIFDWISFNTKYSYALEYSTIPNIPHYVLSHRYGDCGQHGMTFIAFCRYNGIPARWQSGWSLRPGDENLHDWTEIYLEGYGWVPCDPDMGVWVTSQNSTLTPEQSRLLREFYTGNIDHYRMIVNGDHARNFTPVKKSFRSDDVDFQRAELECNGKNIYFGTFKYDLQVNRL